MGNCTTRSLLGYEELRNSIPGSLISDHDFDLFYSLCKIETIGSISSALHPSKNQLFYVVISGQVVVHLTSSKIPNICATTFYSGDMIHFFNSPINSVTKHDINCIRNGNIALSLQFKGYTEKMGRVIGIDKINFEKYLLSRFEHKQPLVTLLNINMSDLMKESRLLHSMTLKQVIYTIFILLLNITAPYLYQYTTTTIITTISKPIPVYYILHSNIFTFDIYYCILNTTILDEHAGSYVEDSSRCKGRACVLSTKTQ